MPDTIGARPCTLLYIDPDLGTRLLVRRVLEPEGITVVEAQTLFEAEHSASGARPDVVLIDVDRVDTAELLPVLKRASVERTVWLASTAHPWPEHCERILASGFERVLPKPLDIDTLAEDIGCGTRSRTGPGILLDGVVPHGPGTNGAVAAEPVAVSTTAVVVIPEDEAGALGQPAEPADERELAAVGPVEPRVRELPHRWHLTLAPVTASFVRSIPTTHGLLVLLDESETILVLVAAYSIRSGEAAPLVGTSIAVEALRWLDPALRARQATVVSTDGIAPGPFLPRGCSTMLIVPVATAERVYGVAILGEERTSRAGAFAPPTVAQSVAEARQIALVVDALRQLEGAIRAKRSEMLDVRLDLLHGLLTDLSARSRRQRKSEAGRERSRRRHHEAGGRERLARLALDVARTLELPPREREVLRQALDVEDVGRTWLEHMLFPRMTLPASVREALLDSYASHSAEILNELDWPASVVELVRIHRTRWDGEGSLGLRGSDIPLQARILAVAAAYGALTSMEPDTGSDEASAELERHAGHRLDPDVVAAFIERLAAAPREA
jgi:response regulator RpfG family c-di-GMP phosphodiesterase